MAQNLKFILLITCLAASLNYSVIARPLASGSNLMAGLKLDKEASNCWDSLIQLQACTSEITLFFLNGEVQLGMNCCHAIRIITEQCWPNLINTLGFTNEESDILEGYCVKETEAESPSETPITIVKPKQNLVP